MRALLFLRAKHWHIFLPLMLIPFVTMIIFMIIMVARFVASPPDSPEDITGVFYFMPIFSLICMATQLLWIWNVAVNLRKYILSPDRKPRIKLFYFTFFLPLVYLCIMPVVMVGFLNTMTFGRQPDLAAAVPFMLMMTLGNAVMMFCFLNNNYVVAKTIKMAELQRKVSFSDFAGDFFFQLIFPVAIWFLQPRINKIVNAGEDKTVLDQVVVQRDLLD